MGTGFEPAIRNCEPVPVDLVEVDPVDELVGLADGVGDRLALPALVDLDEALDFLQHINSSIKKLVRFSI